MRRRGAFMALLLLLVSGASAVIVEPPTDVTVSCRNLNVTVTWAHSKQQPHTSFTVHIGSSAGNDTSDTTERQYDLSRFVWASEERYMGVHHVTITAVQGDDRSKAVESKTFSFNDLKLADIKCNLSFPPVDLKVEDSEATVVFRNPLHFYRELKEADKPDSASFKFTVSTYNDSHRFEGRSCPVDQENCKLDFSLPEGVDECVTLNGRLLDGNGIRYVLFNETARICPSNSTDQMLLITLLSIIVLILIIIAVVTVRICKTKAWTMKEEQPIPEFLLPEHTEPNLQYYTAPTENISDVTVYKPCKRLSVSSEEEEVKEEEEVPDRSAGSCGTYMGGSLSESSNQELEAARLIPEGHGTDDDSADDSVKTECVSIDLESEQEERSPYDSPQNLQVDVGDGGVNLQVDMGDGDMVTAYNRR